MHKIRNMRDDDIIAAIATGFVESAIGIIRVSGDGCFNIIDSIFDKKILNIENRKMYYGHIVSKNGIIIDEVLISTFKSPYSFTGEDSFEINTHGGIFILKSIMELLFSLGIRAAEPGEFTKRAFLNGKIDLTQAEAVAKVIAAKNQKALDIAQKQLSGYLSSNVEDLRNKILLLLAENELNIDHLDDDGMSIYSLKEKIDMLDLIEKRLRELLKAAESGKNVFDGFKVAIIGRPNVGKSSLLNAILGFDRSIVTNIPGTTRDVVSEGITIQGLLFTFMDTAGIRNNNGVIEEIGIQKSINSANQADIVIVVFDGSEELKDDDKKTMNLICEIKKPVIVAINKVDRPLRITCNNFDFDKCLTISSKEGKNIDMLIQTLSNMVMNITNSDLILLNSSQVNKLRSAINICKKIKQDEKSNIDPSLIAIDIMSLVDEIDEITGRIVTEDILDTMFKNFCVGK